jgi:hypothetical protein
MPDSAMSARSKSLADAIERDRFLRARRLTVERRLVQGAELFDFACEASLAGLRAQFPAMTGAELQARLRQRLMRARELEGLGR